MTAAAPPLAEPTPDQGAMGFVRALRAAGVAVPLTAAMHYVEALGAIDLSAGEEIYWAGRTTLVCRVEDLATYDGVFAAFYLGHAARDRSSLAVEQQVTVGFDDDADDVDTGSGGRDDGEPDSVIRFSRLEALHDRDFAECEPDELVELWQAIARLKVVASTRRSSRTAPTRGAAPRLDLRGTVGASFRTGGEIARIHSLRRTDRPRRIVVLIDVSGSMEPYARALLRFAHAVRTAGRRVEVFALGTRLTRLTRELEGPDPDAALARSAAAVSDWSGGTRLGETLGRFCDEWGQRGTARGATVVIVSDGWDRGDPADMVESMARVSRLAHRVVWVNPLRASPGYAPLARGMAAALPYCDRFVDGHSLRSLRELVNVIDESTLRAGGRP